MGEASEETLREEGFVWLDSHLIVLEGVAMSCFFLLFEEKQVEMLCRSKMGPIKSYGAL